MTLDEIIDFFCRNQIQLLPCHGILNGTCTCKKGKDCPSPGKHPLLFRWQLISSFDRITVSSWFKKNSGRPINLAIRTGVKNPINGKYLVGADFDLVNHPMKERLERVSKTVTQQSGSGGSHALYWSSLPIKNSVQLVDEKMDIRGSGGIIVIAPSLHKSGRNYKFTCDLNTTDIQDLPEILERKIRISVSQKQNSPKRQTPKQSANNTSELITLWGNKSITSIRNDINNGVVVPVGVRNATMHRLLSSDRARGAENSAKLFNHALDYIPAFEDPDSFQMELTDIVKSVMKYPAYNNSHEKVNELYIGWLGKKGYPKEHKLEELNSADDKFFSSLEQSENTNELSTLQEITERRSQFMNSHGLTKYATYRSQLLAKKLESLGFKRKRTAKGNFWSVKSVKKINDHDLRNETKMECIEMASELKDESRKKGLKDGDIIDYKGKKARVELIKTQVKNRVHPKEHLYTGKTGYDYNKAFRELLSRLTPSELDLLAEDQLVMNKELTLTFAAQICKGDLIGILCDRYEVMGFEKDPLSLSVRKVTSTSKVGHFEPTITGEVTNLSMAQIDHARELNLVDILWRDGKLFGADDMQDMTIVLLHDLDEDNKNQS